MNDNDNPAAVEIRCLLLEAGRLAERSGMPPQDFASAFMDVLKALIEQEEEADRDHNRE